ncbi:MULTISPECIES: hypothetical protein [unclassified Bradyrhizobium]|uniref:hypothetical protein n=1 Tax=unclassified Bradyrhizobium TaxID=2631580 RepID=UPI0028F0F28E|nr:MULTISPECIES: hypothetical protein [unclassified Bradyrhizobium]
MKRAILMAALLLAGCDDGDNGIPKPRLTCTQVTAQYPCGRGGTCEQCGNWQIGCPKPLELHQQIATGKYGKDETQLVCRLKEHRDVSASSPMAAPLR